jgi:regulator of protease activity HflC (stomatin/prohibitin superfamily)
MTPINRLRARLPLGRLRFAWPFIGALLVVLIAYTTCSTYVEPGQVGIKQRVFGSGQGVQTEIYQPGLHWITPGAERMHLFPATLQMLEMSDSPNPGGGLVSVRTVPALKIQTSAGSIVSVDATVLYRIEDAYKVMTQIGPGRLYEDSAVILFAQQQLRRMLGELDAEDFYKGDKREKAASEAQRVLTEELSPKGIHVTHVLVRQYRYDSRYQQAIEQRKIQDQTVFKNQAEALAAQAEAEKNKIIAEGIAAVEVELGRGSAEVQKLTSEAELYRRTKDAEGQLQVKLAKAQGIDLDNKALRGIGSENMVGLRMAETLRGIDVIVLPSDGENGTNPLDLNQVLKRFDVKGL